MTNIARFFFVGMLAFVAIASIPLLGEPQPFCSDGTFQGEPGTAWEDSPGAVVVYSKIIGPGVESLPISPGSYRVRTLVPSGEPKNAYYIHIAMVTHLMDPVPHDSVTALWTKNEFYCTANGGGSGENACITVPANSTSSFFVGSNYFFSGNNGPCGEDGPDALQDYFSATVVVTKVCPV